MSDSTASTGNSEMPSMLVMSDGIQTAQDVIKKLMDDLLIKTGQQNALLLNNPSPTLGDSDYDLEEFLKRFAQAVPEQAEGAKLPLPPHYELELRERLSREVKEIQEIIKMSEEEVIANDKECAAIDKQIKELRQTITKRETEGEMKEDLELDKKVAAARKVLTKNKNLVVKVLEELFENDDNNTDEYVQNMLRDLTNAHLKPDKDPYVALTEEVELIPVLSLLYEAGLVVRHPYDKTKIRLAGYD